MNNKGFLLNELLICSALSFIIIIAIFNSTISLNQRLNNLYIENKALSKQIILNRKIAYNYSNYELNSLSKSNNKYTLKFDKNRTTTIEVAANAIYVNNTDDENNKEMISLDQNMKITSTSTIFNCVTINNKSLVSLKIPITYTGSNNKYGIELYNITQKSCTNIGIGSGSL